MAQPSIIVYSAADVEFVPMLSDDNVFTGDNTFSGASIFSGDITTTADIIIDSDTAGLKLGADQDIAIVGTGAGALSITPAADTDLALTFVGTTHSGLLTWMEDEDYFKFGDDLFMYDSETIYFRDTNAYIYSGGAGSITIVSTNGVLMTTDSVQFGRNTTEDIALTFAADPNDGAITWKRTEDYFQFGDDILLPDNEALKLGTGVDASISYDGTNLLINPKVAGTGYANIQGQTLVDDKVMFTQTDGNEYIDSLADGYLDLGATTSIRLHGTGDTSDPKLEFVSGNTGYIQWLEDEQQFYISGAVIVESPGVFNAGGGLILPSADPHIIDAWWDNAGTLTKSAG